jgi:hypothetical protein
MKSLSKNEGLIVVGLLAILVLYSPVSKVSGYWSMDKSGNMIQYKNISNQVLGEEDKSDEQEKKETEKKQEETKKNEETKNEVTNKLSETREVREVKEVKEIKETKEVKESEIKQNKIKSVEIHKAELENKDKIDKDKIEDNNEIDASGEGDIEVEIKKVDNKELKEKQESFEMETENGDKVHIELSPEKTQFEIKKNGVSASIELPLSVDPLLKKLVVATADGNKTLESLPDEVINKLKTEKKLETGSKVQINLQIENGQIVYHIEEVKRKKIVGVIPVDLTKNLSVSDSTGVVLSEQESFLTKILNLISI